MNMLYETMRSGLASVIVVPSSALDSMNLGAIGGLKSLIPPRKDETTSGTDSSRTENDRTTKPDE